MWEAPRHRLTAMRSRFDGGGYPNEKMVRKYFLLPILCHSPAVKHMTYLYSCRRESHMFFNDAVLQALTGLSIFFLYRFLIPPYHFVCTSTKYLLNVRDVYNCSHVAVCFI
jgi:hypothetical protein